jgi:DNA adenine methylase
MKTATKKSSDIGKSFLKYLGGKGQFVEAISRRMPPKFGKGTFANYYEPFLGGGSMALNMLLMSVPRKAFLSDITPELINAWQCIQRSPSALVKAIAALKTPTCFEDFEAVKHDYNEAKCHDLKTGAKWICDMDDKERFAIAAKYIWLSKTCFNGVYRVNKKENKFNVAWNTNLKPCLPTLSHLDEISLLIRNAEITCQSFETALRGVQENDLIYADPPYDKTFADYTSRGFGAEGHVHLFNVLQNMSARGAHVYASNSDTPYVLSLYADWEQVVLQRRGTISSDGSDRGKVNELLLIKRPRVMEIAA